MLQEHKVLSAAMYSRNANELLQIQGVREALSDTSKVVYDFMQEYYSKDEEADKVDKQILITRAKRKYPSKVQYENITGIIKSLNPISVPNVLHELKELKLEALANKLSQAFAGKDYDAANKLLEKYEKLKDSDGSSEVKKKLHTAPLHNESDQSSLEKIPVLPTTLNRALDGGVIRGNHVVVFAPTETGKTALLMTMTTGFIKQGFKVLYLGNEEPRQALIHRVKSRITLQPVSKVIKYPKESDSVALKRGYANLTFLDTDEGSKQEITAACEEIKPDVLVIDQLRNVKAGRNESQAGAYEDLARFARKVAKKYNMVVISACQAGARAFGRAMLTTDDIDGSHVGIPGAADLMIGMGQTDSMREEGTVYLSVCKNKINGYHGGIKCRIDPYQSKVY